jgi:hypothetical protein
MFRYSSVVRNKTTVGVMLAAAVLLWIFVPGSTSTIFIVLGIAANCCGLGQEKKEIMKLSQPPQYGAAPITELLEVSL